MNIYIAIAFFMVNSPTFNAAYSNGERPVYQAANSTVSIIYPRSNQKVRGYIKIYGKAKPGSQVKLYVTSTYFAKMYKGEKLLKGAGPLKGMNQVFNLTTDKSGLWTLKEINLTNRGWEENFTIKAVSGSDVVAINVYDHTKPVIID
ncbi:hypothetical protein [Niabella hibiscisoli]|uniref:hypothetical protein n=1 Tax=Niabella hibiscisoli TaxID=1825928 RepID=UPI001F0FE263|nr:hypothetical protein [Niabella hibiscisoli]MCH5715229.1 hypothetical protein [Niabella hibiscisoli]